MGVVTGLKLRCVHAPCTKLGCIDMFSIAQLRGCQRAGVEVVLPSMWGGSWQDAICSLGMKVAEPPIAAADMCLPLPELKVRAVHTWTFGCAGIACHHAPGALKGCDVTNIVWCSRSSLWQVAGAVGRARCIDPMLVQQGPCALEYAILARISCATRKHATLLRLRSGQSAHVMIASAN